MQSWVVFTFLHGIFKGFFECFKKKSIEKNSIYEVLAYFSLIAFLLVSITSKNVFGIQLIDLFIILIKSIIIIIALILSLYTIKRLPISLYSMIYVSAIIFSVLLSVVFLGEKLATLTIIGMGIIVLGLILMNYISNDEKGTFISFKIIFLLLICCFLNSISSIFDKIILSSVTSGQLQFWYLLFLTVGFWLILLIKERTINIGSMISNYWIPLTAICLVVGDRFLFLANEIIDSKVSIMTLLKQVSTIEVIVLSKFIFKEKNIIKKLLCSILVIFGIALILI